MTPHAKPPSAVSAVGLRPRQPAARSRRGAGKTTTVQILSTLITADGGDVGVAGRDVAREPDAVRRAIGVTGQLSAVDELLTGEEMLASYFGSASSPALERLEELSQQKLASRQQGQETSPSPQ
jgi:ABC-type multidrug transport system ATPase subunit